MKMLDVSQQRVLAAQNANCFLGCTKSSVASRVMGGGIVPLCSALLRPHLEPALSSGTSSIRRTVRASPEEGHEADQRAGACLL